MLSGWMDMAAEQDGPFWAVNLMKYRDRAEYADGRETTLTGKEADDLYAPFGPIEAVGGTIAFGADVASQISGSPTYDRVAVVRYPSRSAFFEMQRRDDFQELHVHKDAGMEFTTVLSCAPESINPAYAESEGKLVMRVRKLADGASPSPDPDGLIAVTHFGTEGVIIGDGSVWHQVLFDLVPDQALDRLVECEGVEDQVVMVLDRPVIDALIESVEAEPK
jgi:hypothetical protein